MTDRRRFQVVPPDWGEAHLTLEAVVAYVDDELAAGPHDRAHRHLERCPDCASEVAGQRRARTELRGADAPTLPPSLMSTLRAIPRDTDLPAPPAGLALTPDGELVSVLRPAALAPSPTPSGPDTRRRRSRRVRLGTGAAVSGFALGALAFAVPGWAPATPVPGPSGPHPGDSAVARIAVNPSQSPAYPSGSTAPATPASGAPGVPATPAMRHADLPPSG
ncbi:zf-HC2 domain-containing protein [Pseudonocardia nematodicida]|uniref:Zf-HC2 domain-containing protein n=1 Tax=Pseudonocardia nematodicida TaxID=1206997 RepID=A0ABV1KCF6_9PSEU